MKQLSLRGSVLILVLSAGALFVLLRANPQPAIDTISRTPAIEEKSADGFLDFYASRVPWSQIQPGPSMDNKDQLLSEIAVAKTESTFKEGRTNPRLITAP